MIYRDLWPGIDLVYSGETNKLKYTFNVSPGADPKKIRLAYCGAGSVVMSDMGGLEVNTPVKSFSDERPISWQDVDGKRIDVGTACKLEHNASADRYEYGFTLGPYNPERLLVIDPAVIVYCGYIGGSGGDEGCAISVDSSGRAYVTGSTLSDERSFPVTTGPDVEFNGGTSDVFVARVNASGEGLDYCGYIGGSGSEDGYGISVDSDGIAYVTGVTNSDETSFPVTAGPDVTFNGSVDAFVTKVLFDVYGDVIILSPNGGEHVGSGETCNITWGSPLDAVSFKLKYTMNNGRSWQLIEKGVIGNAYPWVVPVRWKNKKKCRVKVTGYNDLGKKVGASKSDSVFIIEVVRLTSPVGGEIFASRGLYSITWDTYETKKDVSKVKLFYTKNNGRTWKKITTLSTNPGAYDWIVPDVNKTRIKCRVKVVLKTANEKCLGKDISDATFIIVPAS